MQVNGLVAGAARLGRRAAAQKATTAASGEVDGGTQGTCLHMEVQ